MISHFEHILPPAGKPKRFRMADFFCGAGGTSTGTMEALLRMGYLPEITAVNHWKVAVGTHTRNHPTARHYCTNVDDLRPTVLYPGRKLNALWASPSCRMHSQANSGDLDEQDRASAHCVTRWAEALGPDTILIENVPQFRHWGPIDHRTKRPILKRQGETFHAWLNMFRALGYKVDYRVLVCADYGDPTNHERLHLTEMLLTQPRIQEDLTTKVKHAKSGACKPSSERNSWK